MPACPKIIKKKETKKEKQARYRSHNQRKARMKREAGKPTRDYIHQRDREMCFLCGYVKGSKKNIWNEVAHIDGRTGPREFDPMNQCLLCKSNVEYRCHQKVDDNKKYWKPRLKKLIQERYGNEQQEKS